VPGEGGGERRGRVQASRVRKMHQSGKEKGSGFRSSVVVEGGIREGRVERPGGKSEGSWSTKPYKSRSQEGGKKGVRFFNDPGQKRR